MSQIELTTLGKSCEFYNGKAHEKSINENGKYIVVNSKFISQEGRVIKRTKEQLFPLNKGEIVMVMSDVPNGKALAKCFIIDKDDTYSLNQRICCIRSKEFDTRYLYYQLNRHEHFLAFNNGENQTNLRKDDILACPLIKPSMEEQKRMVEELDETFLKLKLALANTERNLGNSGAIFGNYFQNLFHQNKEKWESKAVKECISENLIFKPLDGNHGEIHPTSKDFISEGVPFLMACDIKNGTTDQVYCKFISEKHAKSLRTGFAKNDDVLLSHKGTIGRVAILKTERDFVLLTPQVTYYRIKDHARLYNRYLYYYFQSSFFQNEIKDIAKAGSTRAYIGITRQLDLTIIIPTLSEQFEIVDKLDKLILETNKLDIIYQKKIECLNELNGVVLKKAFENELIEAEL